MKRFVMAFALGAGVAMLLIAQADKDYQTWMKTAGGSMGALKKAIDAKSGAEAAATAKKLDGVFGDVAEFWEKRGGASDAVGFAKDAQAAAKEIASNSESGGDANTSFGKLGATCKGCHATHREKAEDGSWKIK